MIVVDVETTGLDPRKHALLSIGAVDFLNPKKQFYGECRMWEGAEVFMGDEYYTCALNINGFTEEQIHDPTKKSVQQLIQEFFCGRKTAPYTFSVATIPRLTLTSLMILQ